MIKEGEWDFEELKSRKTLLDILKINHNATDPINKAFMEKSLEESHGKLEEFLQKSFEESHKKLEEILQK